MSIQEVELKNICGNDYYTSVSSLKKHCLRLVSPDPKKQEAQELVIYLHGDYGVGGSSYMKAIAAHFPKANRMNIALIRPGYFDDKGHFSSGSSMGVTSTKESGRLDNYTRENVDIIADAIGNLKKKHYHSNRVIVIGHSGGAALAALILNYYPQLIDEVLLINCPCDLKLWRPDWEKSLSPIEHINNISPHIKIHILSGAEDEVVAPELCKKYAEALKKINHNTEFFLGLGMKHNLSDEATKKIVLQHIHHFLEP